MEKRSRTELLAPAGSMESLKAGVNAGADAVDISGKSFGARYYANNFSKAQMIEALDYAHLRNVKVYVTVNTLVNDFELEEVAEYLLWLYNAGVDAVILQDVGVASLCRELVPDLDMHASTQMTITSAEGVKWVCEYGFKRVVLARELKLSEIEEITGMLDGKIELEIFAHGALCYCYSGQCLLSSVIGGRSGNRGQCAQPCRKLYQLIAGEKDRYGKLVNHSPLSSRGSYLLSTRDLATYPQLDKISVLPLDSLKIEGRMRSPEYVAIVISIYRNALDNLENDNWTPDKDDLLKLKLAFNRGFTRGYLLENRNESVMGRKSPGNRGLYLGSVIPVKDMDKTRIKLDKDLTDFTLEKGDGIVFTYPETQRKYGMAITSAPEHINPDTVILRTKKHIPVGSKVHLTRDLSLYREVKSSLGEDRKGLSIPMDINMWWDEDLTPQIKAKFTRNNNITFYLKFKADFKMEIARKSPLTREKIKKQLKKTGSTPFTIKDIKIDYPGNLFTPISKLNRLRRQLLEEAENELLNSYKPSGKDVISAIKRLTDVKEDLKPLSGSKIEEKSIPENTESDSEPHMDIAIYTSNLETIKGALNGGCKKIYFEPSLWEHFKRKHTCEVIDWETHCEYLQELLMDAQKLCTAENATLIWKWPEINHDDSLRHLSQLVKPLLEEKIDEIMIGNMGTYNIINRLNVPVKIVGSAALNIWNYRTVFEYSRKINRLTLSNELSRLELKSITSHARNYALELVVQGNLESMISEDCLINQENKNLNPTWGIEDKNRIFPLIIDDEARTHIMNSVELCLIDHIPDLYGMGFQNLSIDARHKTREYARVMVSCYSEGLNYRENRLENIEKLNKLKNKVKRISQGGITTGNFLNTPYKFK